MSYTTRISLVGVFLFVGLFAARAHAATITVGTTSDDLTVNGNCTLREAIKAANTNLAVDTCSSGSASGTDTVVLGANTYTLTILGAGETNNGTGDLNIFSNVAIQGDNRTTTFIDGNFVADGDPSNFDDRIIAVSAGGALSLTDLTVDGGNVTGNGGGINNAGSLTLTRVDVTLNNATGNGGAIYNANTGTVTGTYLNIYFNDADIGGGVSNAGTLTISKSFFEVNQAVVAGGAFDNTGTATVTNSTVFYNIATGASGAGFINSGSGVLNLDSDTIYSNVSSSLASGISVMSGTVNMQRTILADNTINSGNAECGGPIVSGDYNLVKNSTCSYSGTTTHNLSGVDPKLDSSIAISASGTGYLALLYGSPAIDTGGASCLANDVADTSRPQVGKHSGTALCDIGAFEYILDETAPTVTVTHSIGDLTTNTTPTLTVTASESGQLSFNCTSYIGLPWSSTVTAVTAGVATTVPLHALSDGTFTCTVRVTDGAENIGSSSPISFKLDTHGPTLQMSTVTGTRTTTVVSPYSSVTINITTSELGVFLNTGACPTPIMNSNGYGAQFTFNLPDGTFTGCTLQMRDSFGNLSNTIIPTIIIDTQRPTGRIIGPSFIELKLDQKYTEYGAVGFDARDASLGLLPSYRRILHFTDASHAGRYSIDYLVQDQAGGFSSVGTRTIVVKPKITTLTSKGGKITVTFNGKTKTFTPFKGYSNSVYALQVSYGREVSDQYFVFVATMPTGINKVVWQTWNGKSIGTGVLSKALQRTGINVAQNFDASTNTFLLALGSTRGTNQPMVFALTPTSIKNVSVNKNGAAMTGNVSLKFLPLMTNNSALVTTVNGRRDSQRVWWYNNDIMKGNTFAQSQVTYDGKTLTQVTPSFRDLAIYANPGGRVVINWKTTVNANYTIEYGASKALGKVVKQKLVAESQQAVLSIPSNSGFWYRITACNPKVNAKIGCASTSISSFISI